MLYEKSTRENIIDKGLSAIQMQTQGRAVDILTIMGSRGGSSATNHGSINYVRAIANDCPYIDNTTISIFA